MEMRARSWATFPASGSLSLWRRALFLCAIRLVAVMAPAVSVQPVCGCQQPEQANLGLFATSVCLDGAWNLQETRRIGMAALAAVWVTAAFVLLSFSPAKNYFLWACIIPSNLLGGAMSACHRKLLGRLNLQREQCFGDIIAYLLFWCLQRS